MKGQFYQTMWKSIRCGMMAALAFGAAITFSSCGGGGDSTGLRGMHMELNAGTDVQIIELEEPITKESSIYRGTTSWGGAFVNCNVNVTKSEFDEEGKLTKLEFTLTFSPGSAVLESTPFKNWWGLNTGCKNLSMIGVPVYIIDCPSSKGSKAVREGSCTVKDDDNFSFSYTQPNSTTTANSRDEGSGWLPPANYQAIISHT